MLHLTQTLHAPARLLMAILFLVSGTGKLSNVEATQNYMEAYRVPGSLLWPAAMLEIVGGLGLLVGRLTRHISIVFAGWCVLTAFIFHTNFEDQGETINLMKNLVMAGGFLVLADHGKVVLSRRRSGDAEI